MTFRTRWSLLLGLLLLGYARPGAAQSGTDVGLADSLFREARQLFAEGDYAAACPKFAESHRLDPASGTLLNLAACHEAQGKLATARTEFEATVLLARRENHPERGRVASERLAGLEPRLAKVAVVVPGAARAPGLEVSLDGTVIAEVAWGVPVPVDPGAHVVRVQAPGKRSRAITVAVDTEGQVATVTVEPLTDAASRPPPSPPPASTLPANPSPSTSTPPQSPSVADSPRSSGRRATALVIGGAGLASLGVGAYCGVRAIDKMAESDDECPNGSCSKQGADLSREANAFANAANVGVGVGLVGVGVAAILLVTSGDTNDRAHRRAWRLSLTTDRPGVTLRTSF